MGGKHKVANRTKNNARPSSSGRSAELLGTSIPQFVGFSGIKDSAVGFPSFSLTNTEELDSSIDSNFQLVLKKITKKDCTTKLKGLQEFADLVKISEPDSIKPILPVWPRFYNVLATDTDNRVREATHIVHHQIVLKAKRNIAPYLKQLMAPWFTSQYDTYPPAASAASEAFKDAFPTNKFQEAIIFCQEEILYYINDNLLIQTAQTLSGKHSAPEDAEAKYQRVLISCLQGYALYLEKVPPEKIQEATKSNADIVSSSKFWKLAKHKVPPIRAAWFKVLTIICQKAIFLLEGRETQIMTVVLNNIEENEPTVLPYVWECALLLMSSIPEWWKFVNIEKLYLPRLWKVLKQGGQGNATVIYPNLLPIISHLPSSIEENALEFYNTFFENLRIGLKQKSVTASRSESSAVATSFIECLQYVILKQHANIHLCKTLVKNHLLATIEWCLLDSQTGYKTIFNQTALLVQYWGRNSSSSEACNACLEFFFTNLVELFSSTLNNTVETRKQDVASVSIKQIELLQSIKKSHKPKKHGKVKFSSGESRSELLAEEEGKKSIIETDKVYLERLDRVVFDVCEEYVKIVEEKQSKELLENLYSLIIAFQAKNFFVNFVEKKKKTDSNVGLVDIYDNTLYKWLKSSDLCSENVVNLIFLLFPYLDEEDKQRILSDLTKIDQQDCLSWCISEALSHPYNKDSSIRNWLTNEKVSKFFVSIVEKEIKDECTPELNVILKLALTEDENGDLFIRQTALLQIIDLLTKTILNHDDHPVTIDACSSLAAYISAIIYTDNFRLKYGDDLLLCLFTFSCVNNSESEVISSDTSWEVNTAWQDAIVVLAKYLSKEEMNKLTSKFAGIAEDKFRGNLLADKGYPEHLAKVIVDYLRAAYQSVPLSLSELLHVFFDRSLISRRNNIAELCKIAEYVKGNMSSPYEEIREWEAVTEIDILEYFAWSFLKLMVLESELKEQEFDREEEEEVDDEKKQTLMMNVMDDVAEEILQSLYDYVLGESFLMNYNNTIYYQDILHYNTLFEDKLRLILTNIDLGTLAQLKSAVKEKSTTAAWFWCTAAHSLYTKLLPNEKDPSKVYDELTENISEKNRRLGLLHLTQVFGDRLSYDNVHKLDEQSSVAVLRCLVRCEDIDVQIAEVFAKIEKIRAENVPRFLYDDTKISWDKLEEIIEVIRLCSSLMKHKFASLNRRHWDFGVLSLVSWASNCLKARAHYKKYQFQAFLSAIASLYVSTNGQIMKMKQSEVKSDFINEWEDVLVESIHADLAHMWLYLAEQFTDKQENILTFLPFLQEYGRIIEHVNYEFIFKIYDNVPKWSKFLKRGCLLLTSPRPLLQLWGYKMLMTLVPGLIKIDTEAVDTNTPHKKGLIFEQFKEKLVQTHEIVNSMLMEFKLGDDSCRVKPSTDSFTYTLAYLLLWDVLLSLCEQSSTELRYQYADWLRNEDLLKHFLNNLFRLMPTEVLHFSQSVADYFLVRPPTENCHCGSEEIERMVCWLYAAALAQLPALVRQWWTGLDTRESQIVEKITSLYVSPHLGARELNDIVQHQTKFKNMTVRVIPSIREVVAVYTVDDAQMELVISLPANYPLGSPDVQCNRQIGGTTHKQWLLQFKKCALHQNGRIWDGLSLWNNNLDKKFDGVEECYICYTVLHAGTYQLPKLSCQTCKKKFHSACLYKWFSTSNKSSCPICRNLF